MSEHETREKIATEVKQRMLPICPFCDSCGTQVESWNVQRVLSIVLQRNVTVEELIPHARSTH